MGVAYRAVWLLRCLVFVTAASLAFVTFDGSLFGWHPFSMSLGYIYYMGEGLILAWSFRQQDGMQRVQGIERHAMVQAVAFLLAGLGFATIAYNKVCNSTLPLAVVQHWHLYSTNSRDRPLLQVLHGKSHFKTLHGKVGQASTSCSSCTPQQMLHKQRQQCRLWQQSQDAWLCYC
jgi:hypothetical protein